MLDEIDRQILSLLQANGRCSNADIAREVGKAPSAILERIRKLEERGIIEGYQALLSPEKVGYDTLAFVMVNTRDSWCETTFKKLAMIPEVMECHSVAGEDCFFAKVRARDVAHLNLVLRDQIAAIDTVTGTKTTIVLESSKESLRLPI